MFDITPIFLSFFGFFFLTSILLIVSFAIKKHSITKTFKELGELGKQFIHDDEEIVEEPENVCPYCGTLIKENESKCPSCGAKR